MADVAWNGQTYDSLSKVAFAITARQLFWIEAECVELPAPFSRRVAEPLDTDAAG
jgi:hypothetical protein